MSAAEDWTAAGAAISVKHAQQAALADPGMSDERLSALLDQANIDLAQRLLEAGVDPAQIVTPLDQVAECFERRLLELDRALAQSGRA